MFLLFLLTFFLFLPFFSSSPSLPSFSLFSPQVAFRSPENLLVCAPTGAGKTNVACLTMLRDVGLHLKENEMNSDDSSTPSVDLSAFKIVYVAPMKALVKEVVESFNKRLGYIPGFQVRELSGDVSMSRKEVMETTLVVTTPEKWYVTPFALTFFFIFFFLTFCCISPSLFSLSSLSLFFHSISSDLRSPPFRDIVTRKSNSVYGSLVTLLIIDEIHLLHDDRGPVLEAIVARTLREVERTGKKFLAYFGRYYFLVSIDL